MTLETQLAAIRLRVALESASHVECLRLVGPSAFDALEAICPRTLYVRDGQMLHSLLLDDQALPLADLYVGCDGDDLVLLVEGLGADALRELLQAHLPAGERMPVVRDLRAEGQRLLGIHGPWAWELLAELVGPEVVGLPYLSFFHEAGWTCFRAGKTGEYGYYLLGDAAVVDRLESRVIDEGQRFDIARVSLEALDHCALENWFFNIRREGRAGLTPLELQLQWRVAYDKAYPGAPALRARRARQSARVTYVIGDRPLAPTGEVWHDERVIGRLLNVGYSPARGDWVGLSLLELPYAVPGIGGIAARGDGPPVPLRTVSPPVLQNRSLFVTAQKHSFATHGRSDELPPLVPASCRPGVA